MTSVENIVCAVDYGMSIDIAHKKAIDKAIKEGFIEEITRLELTKKGKTFIKKIYKVKEDT